MKISAWFIIAMFTALLISAALAANMREGWGWFLFFAILAGSAADDAHKRESR